jgi:hypothetical protein
MLENCLTKNIKIKKIIQIQIKIKIPYLFWIYLTILNDRTAIYKR